MEMEEIFDKLQAVADRYDELNELISDPEVIADSQRFMKLSKEEGSLRETVEKYNQYKKVTQTISDDEELLRETNDDDLTALTKEELAEAREEQAQLEKELEVLLNAVNLETGELAHYFDDTAIQIVDAELCVR